MKNYLIDTNICIYYIKGKYDLKKKFEEANLDNCFISEITLAELMFGVENSEIDDFDLLIGATFIAGRIFKRIKPDDYANCSPHLITRI